jgi:hypothetical protein
MICNHIIDKGRHKTKSSQSHVRRLSLVYINIIDKGRNKKMFGGVKGGGGCDEIICFHRNTTKSDISETSSVSTVD